MTFLPLFNLADAGGISGFGFGIVFVVLLAIAGFVALISKLINGKSKGKEANTEHTNTTQVAEPVKETPVVEETVKTETSLPYTPGYVTLDGVKEQDAAVIMAITSHETGIPLERLCFKYIKRLNQEPELINIEEQDAAVVMAIIADKTGISLDNLIFNSIKLVED